MDKTNKPEYLPWWDAGGPNECEHGYAEGIPCPNCDKIPLVIALRAEIERLRAALEQIAKYPHLTAQIARATLDRDKTSKIDPVLLIDAYDVEWEITA